MSTFKGIIAEFPQIRIDYFRLQPGHKAPLACFLSHVHSDHLVGLESLRAPFVYCSAATREILLRLEKYHYRVNFSRGILESRNVTYDRSMRKLAKPLPLDTPTTIELAPGNNIQVTLIDANHCIGAVMFLIEGDGKAILYTGDIRAEPWWVNSLVQNPILLPYTIGSRRLDCMYLDTTFATKSNPYRDFPSKAEGINELLQKVAAYPDDTIFYFHSWTFGYENVWIALSAFLRSRIHLDEYRTRIYASLSNLDKTSLKEAGLDVKSDNKFLRECGLDVREAPALCGFRNGNRVQPGCLTSQQNVRLHSCECGMGCSVIDNDKNARIVHIVPIVTRVKGTNTEIAELGAGGGKGDLDQKEELETGNAVDVSKILELCATSIKDQKVMSKVAALLQKPLKEGNATINLDSSLHKESQGSEGDLSLQDLVSYLSSHASKSLEPEQPLNRTIRFPYSRHSSFAELCGLLDAFRPKDVFPCTVDENNWDPEMSMNYLFGAFCSGDTFRHDIKMMEIYEAKLEQETYERRMQDESQYETQSNSGDTRSPVTVKRPRLDIDAKESAAEGEQDLNGVGHHEETRPKIGDEISAMPSATVQYRPTSPASPKSLAAVDQSGLPTTQSALPLTDNSTTAPVTNQPAVVPPNVSKKRKHKRLSNTDIAYQAALGIHLTWADYGGLVSARNPAQQEEQEL